MEKNLPKKSKPCSKERRPPPATARLQNSLSPGAASSAQKPRLQVGSEEQAWRRHLFFFFFLMVVWNEMLQNSKSQEVGENQLRGTRAPAAPADAPAQPRAPTRGRAPLARYQPPGSGGMHPLPTLPPASRPDPPGLSGIPHVHRDQCGWRRGRSKNTQEAKARKICWRGAEPVEDFALLLNKCLSSIH